MSLLDPPSFSQFHRPGKRKQPPTADEDSSQPFPSSLPSSAVINPFSHPPGLVRQFAVAGLAHADENPAALIPDFPHRGLDRGPGARSLNMEPGSEVDEETEGDEDDKEKKKKQPLKERGRGGHYEVLLQSVHRFIDIGDLDKASRAYGLLLQLRPGGKPVDIKRHNLWAIGAEILMREGERPAGDQEAAGENHDSRRSKRWGRAANMNKVKAYLDTLIQQHPYDYKHPRAVCAVDFWIALLGCDIYNTHTEHIMGLDRAAREEALETFDTFDIDEDPETQAKQTRDELRLRALRTMRDVTKTMDELMQELPYSKNAHLLRLRAMAALYVADLVVPVVDISPLAMHEAQRARQTEQESAKDFLMKIINNGGELDPAAMAVMNPPDGDAHDSSISVYSSLPIRGL
ncbi:hypothetical protein B0T10DRAFT_556342 [Thelonectria olida]|uniref:Uncharacterized protein n=1 Tax=Thelonectria olida TaxID=1576542 RepID=A0A9P8WGN4_9HYPO|nr:hypothetical protein B0T10DRAFT_556342 [Thelonectria olida]